MSSRVWVSSTLNSLKSIRLGGTSVTGPTVVHSRLIEAKCAISV